MFAQLQRQGQRRWNRSVAISFGLHCAILGILIYQARPVFVTPSEVDHGIPGSSGSVSIVYLAPVGPERTSSADEEPTPALRAPLAMAPSLTRKKSRTAQSDEPTEQNAAEQTARGGSPWGRVPGSPLSGNEVVPALPEVFPDPPVSRADLPSGVEGDVIVEVTIDAQGNVIETKLIQGIGYGVEQKVLAVLQRWHFRPAMRDGVTIASQHIVHFHYPS